MAKSDKKGGMDSSSVQPRAPYQRQTKHKTIGRQVNFWHFTLAMGLMLLALAWSADSPASQRLAGPVLAEVIEVVDGDTVLVAAHIWPDHQVVTRVRLVGIDAPEIKSRCAKEQRLARRAQAHLQALLAGGDVVLRNIRFGKYAGRVLASMETHAGTDVGQALLKGGFARPYTGGKRASWC